MKTRLMILLTVLAVLAGCATFRSPPTEGVRLVAVGDSILAWNRRGRADIPNVVGAQTGLPVFNASIVSAKFVGRFDIRNQYPQGDWDWLVVNGGGNDLIGSCIGPAASEPVLDLLIDDGDLSGAYADFLAPITASGTQVIIVGYAPISIAGGPFAVCEEALAQLSQRQSRLAASNPNITFVDVRGVISSDDLSAYAADRVHPSRAGGALMARQIADVINARR